MRNDIHDITQGKGSQSKGKVNYTGVVGETDAQDALQKFEMIPDCCLALLYTT